MVGDESPGVMTRRGALRAGALGIAALALLDGSTASASAAARRLRAALPRPLRSGLKRRRFETYVGTQLKLRPAGAPAIRARLVAVEDLAGPAVRHLAGSQDAYALRLRVPRGCQLGQCTVGVRHPRFGTLALFVTPSRQTARTEDYVAIVNRVRR